MEVAHRSQKIVFEVAGRLQAERAKRQRVAKTVNFYPFLKKEDEMGIEWPPKAGVFNLDKGLGCNNPMNCSSEVAFSFCLRI